MNNQINFGKLTSIFVNEYKHGRLPIHMFSTIAQCPWREAAHWSGSMPLLDVILCSPWSPFFALPHFPFLSATGSHPRRASDGLLHVCCQERESSGWHSTEFNGWGVVCVCLCVNAGCMLVIFSHTLSLYLTHLFLDEDVFWGSPVSFAWLSH